MSEPQQPPVPPYAHPGRPDQNPTPAPQPPAQPYGAPQAQPAAQAYGAPQGQPYGYPGGQVYPSPATPASGGANGLGRVAFIVALITLAVTLLMTIATPFVYRATDFTSVVFELYNGAIGLIALFGSAAALVLALMAIRRPGSQLLAGIAIGIAGSSLLGTLIGWISSMFYSLF